MESGTHVVVKQLVDGGVSAAHEAGQQQPATQGGAVEAEETHDLSHDQNWVEYTGPEPTSHLLPQFPD